MPAKPNIVGIGELLWDMLPTGKQLGGAPANFVYHARALGAEATVVSCVGKDGLGREITNRLRSLRLDNRYVATHPSAPTGTVDVKLDENGVPNYIIHQKVAWDAIPMNQGMSDLARRTDAVCFGSLAQRAEMSRRSIRSFLAATTAECLRVFDINLRQTFYTKEVVDDSLRYAEVLKLNDTELPEVAKLLELPDSERKAIEELIERYSLQMVALTLGGAGSRLYVPGKVFEHPGYPAEVVDTVGAGDAFTAALTFGLLRKEEPERINERANRLASFVCSKAGGTPQIPADLLAKW